MHIRCNFNCFMFVAFTAAGISLAEDALAQELADVQASQAVVDAAVDAAGRTVGRDGLATLQDVMKQSHQLPSTFAGSANQNTAFREGEIGYRVACAILESRGTELCMELKLEEQRRWEERQAIRQRYAAYMEPRRRELANESLELMSPAGTEAAITACSTALGISREAATQLERDRARNLEQIAGRGGEQVSVPGTCSSIEDPKLKVQELLRQATASATSRMSIRPGDMQISTELALSEARNATELASSSADIQLIEMSNSLSAQSAALAQERAAQAWRAEASAVASSGSSAVNTWSPSNARPQQTISAPSTSQGSSSESTCVGPGACTVQ